MAVLYPGTSVSGYNANPPPDDGSTGSNNLIQWNNDVKAKIGDPLNNFSSAVDTNITAAFLKTFDGATVVKASTSYAASGTDQGRIIVATSSGITITTPDAGTVNAPFLFAINNQTTGSITLAGNATGSQTVDGLTSQTIQPGGSCLIKTDGTNWFTVGLVPGTQVFNPPTTGFLPTPQGYLTLSSDANNIIPTSDITAATAVYYTPATGQLVPIYNGTAWVAYSFSQLTLTLVSNHLADTLYDVFVFLNSGVVTIGTGPAWSTITAGSSARGTGASTTQITRQNGVWTNTVSMTARNSTNTYTVAAGEATYVGTIFTDHTAGEVTCNVSAGQNIKWGVWNAYNRRSITLQVLDSTSSWTYNTATIRASDGAPSSFSGLSYNVGSGTTCNGVSLVTGLAEEFFDASFFQNLELDAASGTPTIGFGLNSTTAFTGFNPKRILTGTTAPQTMDTQDSFPPSLGLNTLGPLEEGGGVNSTVFLGGSSNMFFKVSYKG